MLQRNNDLRRSVGLPAHRISPRLTLAAQNQAAYMARTGQFSHYSNGGPDSRAARFGHHASVRENIAMGQSGVTQVFSDWRNSGGHWASIVSNTTLAGFGVAEDSAGRRYWVAVYGHETAADRAEAARPKERLIVTLQGDDEIASRRFRR
jgi:uncharacterized protein YkwD